VDREGRVTSEEILTAIMVIATLALGLIMVSFGIRLYYAHLLPEPTYLCKGCTDEQYRDIATRCHGVRWLFLRGGEEVRRKTIRFTSGCTYAQK
jgi:hypothetical protein